MQTPDELVRCVDFAQSQGVTRGRVSQWISSGLIGPEAIAGAGRKIRIRPAIALAHLRERLDVKQRFGLNGLSTRLDLVEPAKPDAARLETPAPVARPVEVESTVESQIKAEKLRQTQLATRRLEEQDRLSRGVYVRADEARNEATAMAARLLSSFEGALNDFAGAFAAKHKVPTRDGLHTLREEFRKMRGRLAEEFAALAERQVETIEDDDDDDAAAARIAAQ